MSSRIRPSVVGFCLFALWAFGTVFVFFQMREDTMERFRREAKSKAVGFTDGWVLYPDSFPRDFLFRTMRDEYFEGLAGGRVALTWIDPTREDEIILWIHGGSRAAGNQTLIGEPLDRLGMANRISYDIKPLDEDPTVKGRLHFEVDPWQIQAPTITFLLSSVNVLLLITILLIWLNRVRLRYEASQSELEEKKKELIQQEQLALAGKLSAGLLHDLKKPVIHIREECIDSENPELFSHIKEQSDLFLAMLRDSGLEGFAKSRPNDPEYCDVVELMERSLRLVEYERDDVRVDLRVEGEIPLVWALPTRLMQVFSNLVLNAYQAMRGRGRLEVKIEELTGDLGGDVRITLEDDGPGIPEENLEHLFEPFFTTNREGSGMGLYITRTILNELGGEIRVSNRPDGGARFEIALPEGKD